MVRENRIKELVFSSFSVIGSNFTTYSDHPVNGEILKVRVQNIASPGSLWIAESGIGLEVWRQNNLTSGLTTFEQYPFVYMVNSVNTTGSPQAYGERITNNVMYVAGSGFTSGTGTTFGPVTVYYR